MSSSHISSALLIFCVILASFPIKTSSIALSGCHTKCIDSNIPYSLGMFVVAPLLASTWIVWSKQKKKLELHRSNLFHRNGGNILKKKLSKRKRSARAHLKIHTAEQMKIATKDYSDSGSVLQRSNPEKFYRGTLDNRDVVVMMIPARLPESEVEKFIDEVMFLSQPHRNVVRVSGCCLETSLPLVVYELHGDGNCTLSDCLRSAFSLRQFCGVRAAAEAARGLTYLGSRFGHNHGNFCSGNVLLDGKFDAKVFYAAGSGQGSSDPERSDVYRFGVVLGEVAKCGRELEENDHVVMMGNGEGGKVMKEVAAMAERCLSVALEERPTMIELEAKLTAWTRT